MSKRFLICALFLYTSLEALQIPTGHNSAYFDVQIDRVEQIFADEKYTDWTGVKVKKLNKTRSVIGDVIIYQPLGDEIIVEGRGFMKQGGEYRQMPYRFPQTPMCQFYANDAYVYPELADKSDFPKTLEGNCPLKAVNFLIFCIFLIKSLCALRAFWCSKGGFKNY
ncbi:hypothetical protein ACKWTF_016680 [Chironomus riparius]